MGNEVDPNLRAEALAQPQPEHHDTQPHVHEIDFGHEHGVEGHVCTSECQHTQAEADQFADNLFESIKEPSHAEVGHVCDANCQHGQKEANKFADELFANIEPRTSKVEASHNKPHDYKEHEKHGHVCTAECTHNQKEADQFAEKLFAESVQHGEKDHVCNASCQHNQHQADTFAEKLFTEASSQKVSIEETILNTPPEVREVAVAENSTRQIHETEMIARTQIETLKQAEESEGDIVVSTPAPNDPKTGSKPEMILSAEKPPIITYLTEKLAETGHKIPESELTEVVVEDVHELPLSETTQIQEEYIPTIDVDYFENVTPQYEIFSELETTETTDENIEDTQYTEQIQTETTIQFEQPGSIDEMFVAGQELLEPTSFDLDPAITVSEQIDNTELIPINDEGHVDIAIVLEIIPELLPIREALVTITDLIVEADSSEIEILTKTIDKLLGYRVNNQIDGENETTRHKLLLENIAALARVFGIDESELVKLLGINEDDEFLSHQALEILLGLQKLLSLEYSHEFLQVSSTTSADDSDSTPTVQKLGQMVISILRGNNRQDQLLVASL